MKRTAILAGILSSTLLLSGCHGGFAGDAVTEHRTVGEFDSIELHGFGDVIIVVGEDYELTVTAGDRVIDDVRASIVGSTLVLDENPSVNDTKVEFVVHAPILSSVELLGAGSIDISGVRGKEFAIAVAGAGDVRVSGSTETFVAVLSGAGSIEASGLEAEDATARLTGAGQVSVWANRTLDAELSGVGEIVYRGYPEVTSRVSGLGTVTAD